MKKTQDKKIKSSFTSLPSGGEQLVISNMIVKSMARTEMKFICKFHLKKIRGVYDYTLRALRCLAPPGIDGTSVAVSVSINSQDFAYVGQLTYKSFNPNSNLLSIQSGPTSGSTNVTLYNFVKHIHDDARFDNLPKMKSSMMQKKLEYARYRILLKKYRKKLRTLNYAYANGNVKLSKLKINEKRKQQLLTSQIEQVSLHKKPIRIKHYLAVEDAKKAISMEEGKMKNNRNEVRKVKHKLKVWTKLAHSSYETYGVLLQEYKLAQKRQILSHLIRRNDTQLFCLFGKRHTKASRKNLHLFCKSPPMARPGHKLFRVAIGWKESRYLVNIDPGRVAWNYVTTTRSYNIFEFYSDCYLLKQVSYSTEVGGEILQLKGLNFTGNVAYTVQIGATKVSGLWDASSQAIITKSPPLVAGIYSVKVSANKHNFHATEFFHVVLFSTRVHVRPTKQSSNSVAIFYAGTKDLEPSAFWTKKNGNKVC